MPNAKKVKSKGKKAAKKVQKAIQHVTVPAARTTIIKSSKPTMRSTKSGLIVSHREYVSPVSFDDSVTWNVDQTWQLYGFPIQPSETTLFPWLSTISNSFEQYRFNRLAVRYSPVAGTNSFGSVSIAYDYDIRDLQVAAAAKSGPVSGLPAIGDRVQILQNENCTTVPLWKDALINANVLSLMGGVSRKYTRHAAFEINAASARSSDCGVVYLGLHNPYPGYLAYGDMWVEYEIEFFTPQPSPSLYSGQVINGGGPNSSTHDYRFPISQAFPPPTSNVYATAKQYAKATGPLLKNWATDVLGGMYTTTWNLQNLTPGSVYEVIATYISNSDPISATIEPPGTGEGIENVYNTLSQPTVVSDIFPTVRRFIRALKSTAQLYTTISAGSDFDLSAAGFQILPLTSTSGVPMPQ